MFHIIFIILKIIGITLLILLGILLLVLLLVLFVPVRYHMVVNHGEDLFYLRGRVHWLLHFIHAGVLKDEDDKLHISIRIAGFKIYDNLKKKTIKRKKKVRRSSTRKAKPKTKKHKTKQRSYKYDQAEKEDLIISNEKIDEAVLLNRKDTENSPIQEATNRQETENIETDTNDNEQEEKQSIFDKIRFKMKQIKAKIIRFFVGIKNKVSHIIQAMANLKHKKDYILEFLQNKMNQEGFKVTWSSLVKLCKHILPTKLRSRLIFGTGDPCSTGQALGAMGIIYSLYGDKVKIIPDFENKKFEGTHEARGRIRLATILIIVIKLILDKRFKELKRNVKILKEAL